MKWGEETLTLETGKVARQADGTVIATLGETSVMANVTFAKEMKEGLALELAMNSQAKALNLTIAELESSEDKRLVALVKKTKEAVTAQHELNTEMQRQQQITQLTAQLTQESSKILRHTKPISKQ